MALDIGWSSLYVKGNKSNWLAFILYSDLFILDAMSISYYFIWISTGMKNNLNIDFVYFVQFKWANRIYDP